MENSTIITTFIVIDIILFICVIIAIIYYIITNNKLINCENTENILCPSYYCPNSNIEPLKDNPKLLAPGTKCTHILNPKNPEDNGSDYSAFRYKSNGEIECQK